MDADWRVEASSATGLDAIAGSSVRWNIKYAQGKGSDRLVEGEVKALWAISLCSN